MCSLECALVEARERGAALVARVVAELGQRVEEPARVALHGALHGALHSALQGVLHGVLYGSTVARACWSLPAQSGVRSAFEYGKDSGHA